jgi:hypothetical protein
MSFNHKFKVGQIYKTGKGMGNAGYFYADTTITIVDVTDKRIAYTYPFEHQGGNKAWDKELELVMTNFNEGKLTLVQEHIPEVIKSRFELILGD